MRKRIRRDCASCEHYDGLSDSCAAYQCKPRTGKARKPPGPKPTPVRTDPAKADNPCKGCRYLDERSEACTYAGLGCVQWSKPTYPR